MDNLAEKNISSYIIQSQDEEIKRIALELHEGVGQTMYSLYTGMQFIESSLDSPNLKDYVKEMSLLMEKTIQEIRLLSVELHPPTLTTLGLLPAIKSYAKLYTSTFGIIVKLVSEGEEGHISEQTSIAVFRVCQEAMENAAKYADTENIDITFTWKRNSLVIDITDFGNGFNAEEMMSQNTSFGLLAMKERMALAGGTCMISSIMGEGTNISISVSLEG